MKRLRRMRRNIKYFFPILLKVNPFSIVFILLSALIKAGFGVATVYLPKLIIENLMLEPKPDFMAVFIIAISYCLLLGFTYVSTKILDMINTYYAFKADEKIEAMFNEKVVTIDYFNIEDPKFADDIAFARQSLWAYSGGIYSFVRTVRSIIESILTMISIIGVIIFSGLPWYITLIFIVIVILYATSGYIIQTKREDIYEEHNKSIVRTSRKQWYYNSSVLNFRMHKLLRSYNSEPLLDKYSDGINKEVNDKNIELTKKYSKASLGYFTNYYFVGVLLVVLVLVFSYFKFGITIATLTALYTAVRNLSNQLYDAVFTMVSYDRDCIYQENYINFMEKESIFKNGTIKLESIKTIEFKNVSFKYPRTEDYVLQDLSFKINDKERVSLVGVNGSGKTTIIKLMCRFYDVDDGEILINGINIKDYDYDSYMKQLAVVFQDFKVISFTIKDNIMIDEENHEKLYDCLERAQVLDKVLSFPNKENTYINRWFDPNGVEFSGGELQKFAFARTLYKDASFVVLDEPTSALDVISEDKIYSDFNEIVGEKTCLYISHRLSSCLFCDKIIVLEGSKIIETGTHYELMKLDGHYAKMFKAQAKYYND